MEKLVIPMGNRTVLSTGHFFVQNGIPSEGIPFFLVFTGKPEISALFARMIETFCPHDRSKH